MADALGWVAQHGSGLEGLDADTAADRVRDAGFTPRVVPAGTAVTLEYRPQRVSLHLGSDGEVGRVQAG